MSETTPPEAAERMFERFIAALGMRGRASAAERADWAKRIRAVHVAWTQDRAPKDFLDTRPPRTLADWLAISLPIPPSAAPWAACWARLSTEDPAGAGEADHG